MKQQRRKHDHKGRGRIGEDRRNGERAMRRRRKVAVAEGGHAEHARAEKNPAIPKSDAKRLPIAQKRECNKEQRADRRAHRSNLHGSEPKRRHAARKDAEACAPANARAQCAKNPLSLHRAHPSHAVFAVKSILFPI